MHAEFWWGNLKKRGHLEDLGVKGRIILQWTLQNFVRDMEVFDLAQDMDRWQALVNAVMNLWVP